MIKTKKYKRSREEGEFIKKIHQICRKKRPSKISLKPLKEALECNIFKEKYILKKGRHVSSFCEAFFLRRERNFLRLR